ncbi:MAG: hypothetical protein GF309_10585 [Candidatus Lokiarchaeota archaeon]|nr:hypothetical protein [Candidatus Lokiarchaeota archaeon]
MELIKRILLLLGVLGVVLGGSYAVWHCYMSLPINYGSLQIEFMMVDEADADSIYDTSETFTLTLCYNRFEKQDTDKHLEFAYSLPDEWISNQSEAKLLIHLFNNSIDQGDYSVRHYMVQKVGDREIVFFIVGIVEESWGLAPIAESFTLSIWEEGTGPHPEIEA